MSKDVKRTCSVRRDKDDERAYKIDITFDFEDVEEDQIVEWAVSHLVINAQRVLRTKTDGELGQIETTGYHVKASEAGKGAARDPIAAFKRKFASMTPEEKRAALEDLEGMIE